MAQVTREASSAVWIDRSLDELYAEWEQIPNLAREWDAWNESDRLHFDVDWAVVEDRLYLLQDMFAQGLLDDSQRTRFQCLLDLIAVNRPILNRLLTE